MGLDTTHDCWNGSYGSFGGWRSFIAFLAGKSKTPEHYAYAIPKDVYSLSDPDQQGKWSGKPDDPIWYLLCHSDCDGVIKAEHTKPLADRLEELLPKIPENQEYIKQKTEQFIKGLREANEAKEDVEFQ